MRVLRWRISLKYNVEHHGYYFVLMDMRLVLQSVQKCHFWSRRRSSYDSVQVHRNTIMHPTARSEISAGRHLDMHRHDSIDIYKSIYDI